MPPKGVTLTLPVHHSEQLDVLLLYNYLQGSFKSTYFVFGTMKQELFFQFIKSNSLGPGAKQI
jgi:hypothetical protein